MTEPRSDDLIARLTSVTVSHTEKCKAKTAEVGLPEGWCVGAECTVSVPPAPRPTWNQYGLALAETVASRADCSRRKVGAVIMRPDHSIVATGYNGAPSDAGSCLKGDCPRGRASTEEVPGYDSPGVAEGTVQPSSYDIGPGSCIALHAEQNALLRASWDEMQDSVLYVTCKPCDGCLRMILGTPLRAVVWPQGYRDLRQSR